MCITPPELIRKHLEACSHINRFMAFHPPAFLVKVNIEMSMADLILKIAKSKEFTTSNATQSYELSYYESPQDSDDHPSYVPDPETANVPTKFSVVRTQEVRVEAQSQTSLDGNTDHINIGFENDEQPLHGPQYRMGHSAEVSSAKG